MMSTGSIGPRPPPRPKRLSPSDWKQKVATFREAGRIWAAHREKRPLDLANERPAKSNNPATWREWQDAARFYERTQGNPQAGVGVMLSRHAFGGKGLICLDFDDALGADGMLRPWAQPLVQVFVGKTYVERSLGGRGVHVFLLGGFPEGCTKRQATVKFEDPEAPKAKLEAFSEPHFVALSGDVLFGSAHLGTAPDALLAVLEESGLLMKLLTQASPAEGAPAGAADLAELPRAVEALNAIDPGCERQTWLECGMALHQAFGPKGWEPWSEWSSKGSNFAGVGDCGKVWASFESTAGGVTLGTLFHRAKEAGWKPTSMAPPQVPAVEEFKDYVVDEPDEKNDGTYQEGLPKDWGRLGLHTYVTGTGKNMSVKVSEGEANVGQYLTRHERWAGRLRFNERTGQVECDGRTVDLHEIGKEVLWFCSWRRSPHEDTVKKGVKAAALKQRYDPVADWLKAQDWDGVERLSKLCASLGLEDDHYTRRSLRRWMIGAVARALRPGCEMQTMLVLHGGQGRKKSSLFKRLAVKVEWYSGSHVDMNSKDGQLQLLGPWIVEVAELNGMSKAEVEKVKGFVSEAVSIFRAPYDSEVRSYPRRVVLAGTTNESEFLRDGTGARRFWLIAVPEEIKLDYLTDEVLGQVWAEARVAFEKGERWWDMGEEVVEASSRNEQHYQGTGLDELVAAALSEVTGTGTTSSAILLKLVHDRAVSPGTRRSDVGAAMKRQGWIPTKIRPAGRNGPQIIIFRRPGIPLPGSSEEVREGLLLAFRATTPRPEFVEDKPGPSSDKA